MSARSARLLHSPGPMPQSSRNVIREPVPELARQEDDLASVMALMRD